MSTDSVWKSLFNNALFHALIMRWVFGLKVKCMPLFIKYFLPGTWLNWVKIWMINCKDTILYVIRFLTKINNRRFKVIYFFEGATTLQKLLIFQQNEFFTLAMFLRWLQFLSLIIYPCDKISGRVLTFCNYKLVLFS